MTTEATLNIYTGDVNTNTSSSTSYQGVISESVSVAVSWLTAHPFIIEAPREHALLDTAFMRLSERSFAEEWDSPEDAIYDQLQ